MSRRRTRKQKAKAKHQFTVKWKSSKTSKIKAESARSEPSVKRQFTGTKIQKPHKNTKMKLAKNKGKLDKLASVKHDVVKSLGLAAIILGLEIMIYFFWYVE